MTEPGLWPYTAWCCRDSEWHMTSEHVPHWFCDICSVAPDLIDRLLCLHAAWPGHAHSLIWALGILSDPSSYHPPHALFACACFIVLSLSVWVQLPHWAAIPPLCIPGPWPHPGQIVEAQLPLYPWTHVSEALALFLSPFAVPLMTNTPAFLSLSLGFFLSINS